MFNSIKAKLFLNAFRNLKVSAKSGGNGSFKMKGLNFNLPKRNVAMVKDAHGKILESEWREASKVSIGNIEIIWNFPVGFGSLENGIMEFGAEEPVQFFFKIEDLKVQIDEDVDFELEEIYIEGVQEVKEFFLSLPLEQMAEIGVLMNSEKA